MKKKKSKTVDTLSGLFSLAADTDFTSGIAKMSADLGDIELRPMEEIEKVERQIALDAVEVDSGFMDDLKDL